MTNSYKKVCYSMDDTRELAKRFAELAKDGCFVNLFGDIVYVLSKQVSNANINTSLTPQ